MAITRQQTIMWTPLPNGFTADGTGLKLSVFVSPRLLSSEASPTLGGFADWQSWPNTAVSLSFVVKLAGNPIAGTFKPLVPPSAGESWTPAALWSLLFPATCTVQSYEFPDLSGRLVRSFSTRNVLSFARDAYTKLGVESRGSHATGDWVQQAFGSIGFYDLSAGGLPEWDVVTELESYLQANRAIPAAAFPGAAHNFLNLRRFHNRPNPTYTALPVPAPDFHEALGSLAEYPRLLRLLGLVLDLVVPVAASFNGLSPVQVEPVWTPQTPDSAEFKTVNVKPLTRCELNTSQAIFRAAPRATNPELSGGMLRLADANTYEVVQIDVDGWALKLLNFAESFQRARSSLHASSDSPTLFTVPSVRSVGLSVIRHDEGVRLANYLQGVAARQAQVNNAAGPVDPTLDAEDLLRGYRVDVWDASLARWLSLCERQGFARFLDPTTLAAKYTVQMDDEGWVGPGLTEDADGSSTDLYRHESLFRWAGWSLSAPRPGKFLGTDAMPQPDEIDAAGSTASKAATAFKLETRFTFVPGSLPRLRYGRSYRLRARAVDLAGNGESRLSQDESQATTAITYYRFEPVPPPLVLLAKPTTLGEAVERLVIRSNYNTQSTEASTRHLVPPKASQQMAEEHGMFDLPSGLDPAAYQVIVAKEDGTYAVAAGGSDPIYDLVTPLPMKYLPDPLARGALVSLVSPSQDWPQGFDPSAGQPWYETRPFRIQVVEGANTGSWDAAARLLTLGLPKAAQVEVRLSSYVNAADLNLLGVWQWLLGFPGLTPGQIDQFQALATSGKNWLLTPFRVLKFVHAVQQPLAEPTVPVAVAKSALGQTYAALSGTGAADGKSTDKVEIMAEWTEPIDDVKKNAYEQVAGKGRAGEAPVAANATTYSLAGLRHEFQDTKHRQVTYRGVATSRFREYFPPGTLVTRETPPANRVTVHVPSSARPAAPEPLYVIPTLAWSRGSSLDASGNVTGQSSQRTGWGLRVYLKRPWFSSGADEKLGVVVAASDAPPEQLMPYVTQWGSDPLWTWSAGTTPRPFPGRASTSLNAFQTTLPTKGALTLDELAAANVPNSLVAVAPFDVSYDYDAATDSGRKLWYSDILFQGSEANAAHFPFVRLALVRYQPYSIAGAEISRVVLADFAQLAPNRTLSVIYHPTLMDEIGVTLQGANFPRDNLGNFATTVSVTIETNTQATGDLGWIPQGAPIELWADIGDGTSPTILWRNDTILLPFPRGTTNPRMRLVIREMETMGMEPGLVPIPLRRLVYVETVAL